MDKINAITAKYDADYIRRELASAADVTKFALAFYQDVGEIYDHLTRVKNIERTPTGFSLKDAPRSATAGSFLKTLTSARLVPTQPSGFWRQTLVHGNS